MSGFLSSALSLLRGEQLRQASFRGVPFGWRSLDKDFGRRVVTHKYPLRESVTHEDLGRKERIFKIEGFVAGSGILAQLARLEAALEKPGPGRLVHPYYGELQVVCLSARTMEGMEGGLVTFQAVFEIEDEDAPQKPAGAANGASLVDRLGLSAISDFVEDYSRVLSISGLQEFVADHFGEQLSGLGIGLGDLAMGYGLYERAMGAFGLLSVWTSSGGQAVAVAASATAATTAIGGLAEPGRRPDALLAVAAGAATPAAPAATVQTPSRQAEGRNAEALAVLVSATAAAEAARTGSTVSWASRDEALTYRERVADALDEAADRAGALGWDGSFRALADLRAAWVTHVAAVAAPLPRIIRLTLPAPSSSVLLAYQIDGDDLASLFDRAADIATRNDLAHPGFVPAGEPLEVLTDGQ